MHGEGIVNGFLWVQLMLVAIAIYLIYYALKGVRFDTALCPTCGAETKQIVGRSIYKKRPGKTGEGSLYFHGQTYTCDYCGTKHVVEIDQSSKD